MAMTGDGVRLGIRRDWLGRGGCGSKMELWSSLPAIGGSWNLLFQLGKQNVGMGTPI